MSRGEVGSKINDKEPSLDELRKDSPSEEVEKIIAARDNDWTNNVKDTMKKNFGITKRKLDDFNENNFPYELLLRALNTLKAINTDIDAFDESIFIL